LAIFPLKKIIECAREIVNFFARFGTPKKKKKGLMQKKEDATTGYFY
jgi:hypothetical protein